MPLFEYRCSACAHLEEVLQKHDDPAPTVCPKCGKKKTLHKEISLTSFQLKGGGWYKDLYASSSSSGSSSDGGSESSSASEPKSDSGSEKKGDAKPMPKPAEKKAAPAKKPGGKKSKAQAA